MNLAAFIVITGGCVVIKVYGAASYFLATEGGIFLRRQISVTIRNELG